MRNIIENGQKIGVPVCSALELTEAQLARAEEHAEVYGSVTVSERRGRIEYASGEIIMRANGVITILGANNALDRKQGKKNPGKYLLSPVGK